jgi:hypothetical protein
MKRTTTPKIKSVELPGRVKLPAGPLGMAPPGARV